MKLVDAAAKEAVHLGPVISTPPNPASVNTRIKAQLMAAATAAPPPDALRRLLGTFNPAETLKGLCKLPRPEATFITQIQAGHCPLNSYLHRFKANDSPNCDLCQQREDVKQYLTVCRKYAGLRRKPFADARQLSGSPNRTSLLSNPKAYKALSEYGRKTF